MDIVLGVSLTPETVRMVLVEGEKGDGPTVDHDAFEVAQQQPSATASEQVVAAILGTRESAAESGHRLVTTGVTWRDHDEAAALRDELAARDIDDVLLVSELHAAGALAQAVGRAVGYDRTALMFLERDTATLSVVDTADGSVVKVQTRDLHTADAVAELGAMVTGLEQLDAPPQGVFVVGSGISVAAIKLELDSATSLPVHAPEEAELALARGAALAAAGAPPFEASTVGLAFAKADDAAATGSGGLAYSEVDADEPDLLLSGLDADLPAAAADGVPAQSGRKPFLLVGSAMTSIFVIGVSALVVSLAVTIRPTVDQRPAPGESVVVPTETAPPAETVFPAPTPEAAPPSAPQAPAIETIPAPKPVVQEAPQQAPRTVFVDNAPAAPAPAAPAPAAPAPAAPAPAAPVVEPPAAVPAPEPAAPVVEAPVIAPPVVIPAPVIRLPRISDVFKPPWEPSSRIDDDWDPPNSWPDVDWPDRSQQQPERQQPQWPVQSERPRQSEPQWPQSGKDSDSPRRGSDSPRRGSDNPLWPFPSFGR